MMIEDASLAAIKNLSSDCNDPGHPQTQGVLIRPMRTEKQPS